MDRRTALRSLRGCLIASALTIAACGRNDAHPSAPPVSALPVVAIRTSKQVERGTALVTFEVENTGGTGVSLVEALRIQQLSKEGGWVDVGDWGLTRPSCAQPEGSTFCQSTPADASGMACTVIAPRAACVSLAPRETLDADPWLGQSCLMCICSANVLLNGTFRVVARACDGAQTWIGAPFEIGS